MKKSILRRNIEHYLGSSYRRRKIDATLSKLRHLYHGKVLDIGGRDRGMFKKPKRSVGEWLFADIVPEHHPDIILDVCKMDSIANESIDVVNAIELFEHVYSPETGVSECYRVLKKDGVFIVSMPFLYPIHGDPNDYQRWTKEKWRLVLQDAGFLVEKIYRMGTCISVSLDMLKRVIRSFPFPLNYLMMLTYPILDIIEKADGFSWVKQSVCGEYVGGYIIVARKP